MRVWEAATRPGWAVGLSARAKVIWEAAASPGWTVGASARPVWALVGCGWRLGRCGGGRLLQSGHWEAAASVR